MADDDPGAPARRDPATRATHPQFENPDAWLRRRRCRSSTRRTAGISCVRPACRTPVSPRRETLRAHDVDTLFTLSGGHLFPLYDGCVQDATSGSSTRATSRPPRSRPRAGRRSRGASASPRSPRGRASRTASARSRARSSTDRRCSSIGGRAPQARWGSGSLQELDHVPIVASITKHAATLDDPRRGRRRSSTPRCVPRARRTAARRSSTCRSTRGVRPTSTVAADPRARRRSRAVPDADARRARSPTARAARRPVLMVGGDVYWAGAEAEAAGVRRGGACSRCS